MREVRKYSGLEDYLERENKILFQEIKNWMHLEAYDYNTYWYSMKAFKYFTEHRYDPSECIRAIRLYATCNSISEAYDLGKKLVKEFKYAFRNYEEWFTDAPRFKYIADLIHKYHVSLMIAIISSDDLDNSYYITGIYNLDDRLTKFDPIDDMDEDVKAAFRANSMSADERLRLYQAIMNVLMNRIDIDEQNRLIDASNLDANSNNVYALYTKFMNNYVRGIAYDVENEEIFRSRVLSITDRRIYLEYSMAIEFCIQVYLLGLKNEFMDYMWSIATHYVKDDMFAHHPNASDVKVPVMTPDGIGYKSLNWSLPQERPRVEIYQSKDKSE